jgi:hypothetical protein
VNIPGSASELQYGDPLERAAAFREVLSTGYPPPRNPSELARLEAEGALELKQVKPALVPPTAQAVRSHLARRHFACAYIRRITHR